MLARLLLTSLSIIVACGAEVSKCCPKYRVLSLGLGCVEALDAQASWMPDIADADRLEVRFGQTPQCPLALSDVLRYEEGHFELVWLGDQLWLNATKESSFVEPWGGAETRRSLFPATAFCLDGLGEEGSWVAWICPCNRGPCVRKCCLDGSLLRDADAACVEDDDDSEFDHAFWYPSTNALADGGASVYRLPGSRVACPSGLAYTAASQQLLNGRFLDSQFLLRADGSMQVPVMDEALLPLEFCGDVLETGDGRRYEAVMVCAIDQDILRYQVKAWLLEAGAALLAAVAAVQGALLRLNVSGRVAFHHNVSLALAYAALGALNLWRTLVLDHPLLCVLLAFVVQFSFLAAFFWLNVMCIDISWAFSGLRPPQGSATERDHKKFVWYSVYAWGTTAAISVVTAIVEFVPAIPPTDFKPDFGVSTCWFNGKISTLTFFYGPMALLLICNLILFIFTASRIIIVKRDTSILHKQDSRCHTGRTPTLSSSAYKRDKKRLVLYAKLFCLMGLTWITEIISWLVGGPAYYWYVTDFINLFRAVFIFVMFCCKPNVVRLLRMRLWGACPWCPCALAASPSDLPSDTGKANSTSSIKLTNGIRKMITSNTSNSSIQTANGRTQETAT